jgi:hypothetical protein
MPQTDYFPQRHADRLSWWDNVKTKLTAAVGTVIGFTAEVVAKFARWAAEETAEINDIAKAKADYEEKVRLYADNNKRRMAECRAEIARGKTSAGWTAAIGEDLGWLGSSNPIDPSSYKPEISISIEGGRITIKFKKAGVDGVNIYHRMRGSSEWKFIAFDSRSPYVDDAETAGTHEYQAYGVVADVQIGQPSDIVSVAYGG